MEALVYPFLVAIVLFYTYETDFFVQYVKLFGLRKPFKVDEYEKHLESLGSGESYWEWLALERQTFLRKLLSCPLCTSFWLNIGTYYAYKDIGLLVANIWLSLFLYFILKLLMKKCYD